MTTNTAVQVPPLSNFHKLYLANALHNSDAKRLCESRREARHCKACTDDINTLTAALELLIADRLLAHRRDWANWLENCLSAVGAEPLTPQRLTALLRNTEPPFGTGATS
jgi:hypothetical protein